MANFRFDSRLQLCHSTKYIFRSGSLAFFNYTFRQNGKMPLNFGSIVDDNVTKASFQSFNRVNQRDFDVKTEFSSNTINSFGRKTQNIVLFCWIFTYIIIWSHSVLMGIMTYVLTRCVCVCVRWLLLLRCHFTGKCILWWRSLCPATSAK